MNSRCLSFLILPLALLCLNGCATYEFNIVSPAEFSQHVGPDKEIVIELPPLEYRFIEAEDRLVVQIINVSPDLVAFLGDQSSVVEPSGKEDPVHAAVLATGAHLKVILPPVAHLEPGPGKPYAGPEWADGLGYSDLTTNQPQFVAVYNPGETPFDWPVDTDVRIQLTFQRGHDKPFTQEWVFRKKKM